MIWKEKVRCPVSWPGLCTPATDRAGNAGVQAAGGAPNSSSQGKGVLGGTLFLGVPWRPGDHLCPLIVMPVSGSALSHLPVPPAVTGHLSATPHRHWIPMNRCSESAPLNFSFFFFFNA